jgi:DivIVA domain-containing protein
MDADARFHRVLSGYDPDEVRDFLEEMKRVFAQQAKASKREQETLIDELEATRSELSARNCAIKTMKDTLDHRDMELKSMQTRAVGLTQSIRSLEAERAGMEQLRAAAATARVAAERTQTLEQEVQQLRGTLTQAANVIESWKSERIRLQEENARLRAEIESMRIHGSSPAQGYEQRSASPVPAPQVRQEPAPALTPEMADKLADTFAEAYALVNQFRTANEPPRAPQPQRGSPSRVQVLRQDGTTADYSISGK